MKQKRKHYLWLFYLFVTLFNVAHAQIVIDTIKPNYKKLHRIMLAEATIYGGTIYGLSKAWYTKPFEQFQFVNDSQEWLKMDKVGHTFTAYQIAKYSATLYKTTGVSQKRAAMYGAMSGFLFLMPIEILDGFQYPDYGFSVSDMAANTVGSVLYASQMVTWGRERIKFKYSFHQTSLAQVRPELLGKNLSQQWLKDYNGQTYWLSANLHSFLPQNRVIPKWLNVSLGYGIENMVGAEVSRSRQLGYEPYSQWYLAFDVDLENIHTKNKTIKTALKLLNCLKIPSPTIEWSRREGLKGHWLYF